MAARRKKQSSGGPKPARAGKQLRRHEGSPGPADPGRLGRSKDLGRDGITPMVNHDRALRAREVSPPRAEDEQWAAQRLPHLLNRLGRG